MFSKFQQLRSVSPCDSTTRRGFEMRNATRKMIQFAQSPPPENPLQSFVRYHSVLVDLTDSGELDDDSATIFLREYQHYPPSHFDQDFHSPIADRRRSVKNGNISLNIPLFACGIKRKVDDFPPLLSNTTLTDHKKRRRNANSVLPNQVSFHCSNDRKQGPSSM